MSEGHRGAVVCTASSFQTAGELVKPDPEVSSTGNSTSPPRRVCRVPWAPGTVLVLTASETWPGLESVPTLEKISDLSI